MNLAELPSPPLGQCGINSYSLNEEKLEEGDVLVGQYLGEGHI